MAIEIMAPLQENGQIVCYTLCLVGKTLQFSDKDFDTLRRTPEVFIPFFEVYKAEMFSIDDDLICLLILGGGCEDGVIVQSDEGRPPYRTAYVPRVMSYIRERMACFIDDIIGITPNDDGTVTTYQEDLECWFHQEVSDDSWLFEQYLSALAQHHAVKSFSHAHDWVDLTLKEPAPVVESDPCGESELATENNGTA